MASIKESFLRTVLSNCYDNVGEFYLLIVNETKDIKYIKHELITYILDGDTSFNLANNIIEVYNCSIYILSVEQLLENELRGLRVDGYVTSDNCPLNDEVKKIIKNRLSNGQ